MNKAVLFKNDKKGNNKAPDLNLIVTINGVEYKTGMWENVSKKGVKYYSGTPAESEKQPLPPQHHNEPTPTEDSYGAKDDGDSIPF